MMQTALNPDIGKSYHFENWFDPAPALGFVRLFQAGELVAEEGFEMPEHRQVCHEISYVVSGGCTFYTDDIPLAAGPGDIHLIARASRHRILVNRGQPLRMAYIGFDFLPAQAGDDLDPLRAFYQAPPAALINDTCHTRGFLINLLGEVYARMPYADRMMDACISQLLVHIHRVWQLGEAADYQRTVESAKAERIIGRTAYTVIQYIDRHIYEITGIEQLAKMLRYSPSYLSHLFRERMNTTLQDYIAQRKIEASLALLQDEKNSVTDVAQRLNYQSVQSFGKLFRRKMGCTPTEYRKRLTGTAQPPPA